MIQQIVVFFFYVQSPMSVVSLSANSPFLRGWVFLLQVSLTTVRRNNVLGSILTSVAILDYVLIQVFLL